MKPDKILYTAHAAATGGRDGRAVSSDNVLDIQSLPKEQVERLVEAAHQVCRTRTRQEGMWM
jgi:organic hydroperoxide reductase OsmC/OhrA